MHFRAALKISFKHVIHNKAHLQNSLTHQYITTTSSFGIEKLNSNGKLIGKIEVQPHFMFQTQINMLTN